MFVHKPFILIFILQFACYAMAQQEVTGYVYDNDTKTPLMGASVYYEGTTIGVITNPSGYFSITSKVNNTAPLIISYLGFADYFVPDTSKQPLKVYLVPVSESLDQVVIDANPLFTRKEMLTAFKEQFLGTTKAGRVCKIKNEDAIYLYFDKVNQHLIASADVPIIIENTFLGYEIKYRLYDFNVSFYSKSLKPFDVRKSYYAGTTFYKDITNGENKYKRRREKAYKGSTLHLMRYIANEKWSTNNDFVFFKKSFAVDPTSQFKIKDTLNLKQVKLSIPLSILYKKREQSMLQATYSSFFIDGYGNFHPPDGLIFTGEMSKKRVGDALPLDYTID